MNGTLCRVSGVDPNPDARDVFVWLHDRVRDTSTLLGTGRIVGSGSGSPPPGILKGQYSVTIVLTSDSKENIRVTDDKSAELTDFTVTVGSASGSGGISGAAGFVTSFPGRDAQPRNAGGGRR